MKIEFKLSGRDELTRNAERFVRTLDEASGRQVEASCRRQVAMAKAIVPVRTGALRAAIDYLVRGRVGYVGVSGAPGLGGAAPAKYWRYVEHGTRYVPAHPYMRPAAEADAPRFVSGMVSIGRELERK